MKQLFTAAESTALIVKNCKNKKERLKIAHKTDREKTVAALETEAVKKQDKILENTRITRAAILISDENKKVTINNKLDNLLSSSTASAVLSYIKHTHTSTVNYQELTEITIHYTREEIEHLNQETERKKKEKTAEIVLRSPVKKKSQFVDAKAFERK